MSTFPLVDSFIGTSGMLIRSGVLHAISNINKILQVTCDSDFFAAKNRYAPHSMQVPQTPKRLFRPLVAWVEAQ